MSFLTDEHVPSVFVTTLRSRDYDVRTAKAEFGEATNDDDLLRYCVEADRILVTHDKKDFAGETDESIDHAGIVVYTDANYLPDAPERAVDTLERVLAHYPPSELRNEVVWLDRWRSLR